MEDLLIPNPANPVVPIVPIEDLIKRVSWRDRDRILNELWWPRPQRVRILMYLDFGAVNGSWIGGLQHVINAVGSDPWPWASFQITTANRNADPSADIQNARFDDLDLSTYDQVWLFGFSSSEQQLSGDERIALEAFMDNGGGVLTTGDHANLGRGLSGGIKRLGRMRKYPAPTNSPPAWNTTIRDGNGDGSFSGVEQSDNEPQRIYPTYRRILFNRFPHPLLCSERGVLNYLPDHQHEGEVCVPTSFPVSEWPRVGGFQPRPEIVASGLIVDPSADQTGTTFPLIGAYDGHRAQVGRVVADSTWHHWIDINLDGFNIQSREYLEIISYFQNVAAWLAPASKQKGMRNGVFWLALNDRQLFETDLRRLPFQSRIREVRDALGRWAPECLVSDWLVSAFDLNQQVALAKIVEPIDTELGSIPAPEDAIAALVLERMQKRHDTFSGVNPQPVDLDLIDTDIKEAAPVAVRRLIEMCELQTKSYRAIGEIFRKTTRSRPKKKAARKKKAKRVTKKKRGR